MECSWAPLFLALHIMAKLFALSLCLFDAIIALHAMHEKMSNDFSLENKSGSYIHV